MASAKNEVVSDQFFRLSSINWDKVCDIIYYNLDSNSNDNFAEGAVDDMDSVGCELQLTKE